MLKITSSLSAATLLLLAMGAGSALAQNTRSFVSATGSDSNNCARTSPCRTFATAIAKTNAGGEINTLDPAGYGAVTITKAISIVNGLGEAGVLVGAGTAGITINAGPSDKINLSGIVIEGGSVGGTGIQFNSGKILHIENCVIRNVTGDAIQFNPGTAANLVVSNTYIADSGRAVIIQPTSPITVNAVFNRAEIYNNSVQPQAVYLNSQSGGAINATFSDSVIAHNGNIGLHVFVSSGQANVTMTNSAIVYNGTGLQVVGANSILRLSQSTVTGNTTGYSVSGSGVLASYQDNYIDGNGSNTGSPITGSKQ